MILSIDLCPSFYPSRCSIDLFHRFIHGHHWDFYRDIEIPREIPSEQVGGTKCRKKTKDTNEIQF